MKDELRKYLERTFTTKAQQDELMEFFHDRVNPNLKKELTAQIFRTILQESKTFMQLRVLMREDFKDRKNLEAVAKKDVNKKLLTEKADT